jgi:hypothetical protein
MSTEPAQNGDDPRSGPIANASDLTGLRLGLAAALGNLNTFGDDNDLRDTYETFGWPKDSDAKDYLTLYLRNGYARTVVDKPALTTWRDNPRIVDAADQDETDFETAVENLVSETDLWSYATRVDRLAGIGEHGLLVLGLSDVDGPEGFSNDATESSFDGLDAVRQYRVFHQSQIEDIQYGKPGSDRWGLPKSYDIDISDDIDDDDDGEGTLTVHWTRAVSVPATRLLDDETLSRPRVEPVLNNILDIEKTLGAVAEMAYRGADKGLHLNADPTKVDTSDLDDMDDELQKWYHGVQPWIKTVGTEAENLGGDVADPEGIIEPNLDEIAATTGIPKRELRGNQQGEQAGAEQDEKSYFGTIAERRKQYATPYIARGTIDRFRMLDILPDPTGDTYFAEWPDLTQLSEAELADQQQSRSKVVSNLQTVVPGLRGERAERYVATGEFPERDDQEQPAANDNVDDTDADVQDQFESQFGLQE